ncbi:MAG: hypothetical protein QNJ97_20260 [Myxococcota bacterium]|nr:hypothetical protein [Myxococcota bacterium]
MAIFRTTVYGIPVLLFAGLLCAIAGCVFDPWPEPDAESDNATGDMDSDTDSDSDSDSDDFENSSLDVDFIYLSAPRADGQVTIVGLPGAAEQGDEVVARRETGEEARFDRAEDGGFAGRITAQAGELLYVSAMLIDEEESEIENQPIAVAVGTLEGDPIGDEILGTGIVSPPDETGLVVMYGDGDRLESDVWVLGGNVDQSVGRDSPVVCAETCQFDLSIPGTPGDEVDLFLVRVGGHAGFTDSQTIVIPTP